MARVLCLVFLMSAVLRAQTRNPDILIRDVTVIDATGAPARRNVDVLIRGDRIQRMAAHISVASGTRVIEAHGQFLIPGLWDMHVHVWDPDVAFPLFIANGVTGIRNTGGHADELKRWRQELQDRKRQGPHLVACGPVVDGAPPIHPDHSVVVGNAAQARSAVDNLKSDGWDFIKVYDNIPRDAYFAIAAEAKKDHIPFVGHVPLSVTALEASDAGQKSIEHLEGVDYAISPLGDHLRLDRLERIGKPPQPGEMMSFPLKIANEINRLADTYGEVRATQLFAHFVRNKTWQVPTLSVKSVYGLIGSTAVYSDERLKYVGRQERDSWEHNPIVHIEIPEYVAARKRAFQQAMRITRDAHAAGVPFLAGTDSGGVPYLYYGFSLHDELALFVDAGFTAMQALQAATRDPARFLGRNDLGTIEKGKVADLVLLAADPLVDIHNTRSIVAVVVGGRLLDRPELDSLLSQAQSRAQR